MIFYIFWLHPGCNPSYTKSPHYDSIVQCGLSEVTRIWGCTPHESNSSFTRSSVLWMAEAPCLWKGVCCLALSRSATWELNILPGHKAANQILSQRKATLTRQLGLWAPWPWNSWSPKLWENKHPFLGDQLGWDTWSQQYEWTEIFLWYKGREKAVWFIIFLSFQICLTYLLWIQLGDYWEILLNEIRTHCRHWKLIQIYHIFSDFPIYFYMHIK